MKPQKSILILAAALLATHPVNAQDGQTPANPQSYWGLEPVRDLTAKRGQIVLNGPWQFMPALGNKTEVPSNAWGAMWVPGAWKGPTPTRAPGLIRVGEGPAWQGYNPQTLARAWYRRTLRIPAAWQGRDVTLEFTGLSTDAAIYVNGRNCGSVHGPAAEVDITKAVEPGKDAELIVDVAATPDEKNADDILASPADKVLLEPGKDLQSRGIIGDVFLSSRPRGAHITDVFVQTSTRKKTLSLQVELTGIARAQQLGFVAKLIDEKGREEKRFEQQVQVEATDSQTINLSWNWPTPRLWDLQQPNLYTLKLEATGEGISDEYAQKFGFRELWIEGRKIYLNGTEFRMRPVNNLAAAEFTDVGGNRLAIANHIDASLRTGFNIQEIWPSPQPRGAYQAWSTWYDVADEKGWPMIGAALHARPYANPGAMGWEKNKEQYRRDYEKLLRRIRNHPSVVVWSLDPNSYSHASDQDPTKIGRTGIHAKEPWYNDSILPGMDSIKVAKTVDPTRPVITHHGTDVGDMYTLNNYLCLTPLQEREEWLSQWSTKGDMPYMAIEFGMPLFSSFLRTRDEFLHNYNSEPWVTEYTAIYLGDRAYGLESDAYRQQIRDRYDASHQWSDQYYRDNWYSSDEASKGPGIEELYSLFITNTWRSWRTWGVSGGMVPWDLMNTWKLTPQPDATLPPFRPGTLGEYKATMPASDFYGYGDPRGGYKNLPSVEALMKNNGPTLAYIAGPAAAFTAKDHHFTPGQTVQKQVVLLNDTRKEQTFSYDWKVTAGRKIVASGNKTGSIECGKTLFLPLTFTAPAITTDKADATITLTAKIGDTAHTDAFNFRVYSLAKTTGPPITVSLYDPLGKTAALLKTLGVSATPWTGQPTKNLVVIGREAFSSPAAQQSTAVTNALEPFVRAGGRVLIMEQSPDWFTSRLGLRIAHQVSRRMFPVKSNPDSKAWDGEDLRDWNGSSTLLPEYVETAKESDNGWPLYPRWGWHWGNRHGVSTAALEKPHFGAWRAILEGEFDLAYSPLMELDYGQGRLTLCTLDLEDHAGQDPAANRTSRQVFTAAATAKLRPRADKVIFLGDDSSPLDQLGLIYRKAEQIETGADLIIVGSGARVDETALTACLQKGGKVLFLPLRNGQPALGATTGVAPNFGGSLAIPNWSEAVGLSPSDLRSRSLKDTLLIQNGGGLEVAAAGLLARKAVGKGVALYCQLDSAALEADKYTYLRFTRWRETRALSQLLANLGASFRSDAAVFSLATPKVLTLVGPWEAKIVQKLDGNTEAPDNGISPAARQLATSMENGNGWQQVAVPSDWSQYGKDWTNMNGEAVYRREIDIPTDWAGHDLQLDLGAIDDFDNTFFNGVEIGASGNKIPTWTATPRHYKVPGNLVKPGKNTLSIRVWNFTGAAGLKGKEGSGPLKSGPEQMQISIDRFYHPDYHREFKTGDDPYRYYRW